MIPLTDQGESDFVNAFLDRSVKAARETLRAVADSSIPPQQGAETLAGLIATGLHELNCDETNAVGVSLAYELSLAIRNEINSGGKPYRLDRPRSTMMRTPIAQNAQLIHGWREPLLKFVATIFFYVGSEGRGNSLVSQSLEGIGADRISEYLHNIGVCGGDDVD